MNLWNTKNLPLPPINTYKTTNKNIDIKHLFNVFTEGKNFFEDDNYLYAEYAVLSRVIYRMKQKFRSAKDFKAVEKIYKALDNYFKADIATNLRNFMDLIPSRYKDETYLPTKNLLDYILVRLQGLAKLTERLVETCKISAYLLDKRIHTGHFWKIALIIFSLVSRIYVLAKYTAKFICAFYNKLLPFSSQLGNTSYNWLPEKYVLPNDLKEWLNVEWLEVDDEVQIVDVRKELPDIMQFFDLVEDDDDVEFCNEYVMVDDDEDVEVVKDFKSIGRNFNDRYLEYLGELRGFDTREDVGEVIEVNDSLLIREEVGEVIEVNDSLLIRDDVGEVIEVNDSFLTRDDVGEVIEVNDSLMPDEDNSVQILDDTSTDNLVNGNLILDDDSLQIIDSATDNQSESNHTPDSSSKFGDINVNSNINADFNVTTIRTKQTEEAENSVIEIKDGNDNEINPGGNKTNLSNSVFMFDISGDNERLRGKESVISMPDTSMIEALNIKVRKKKTKKNKKVIKNADTMKKRDELDEVNQESVVNITEVNSEKAKTAFTPDKVNKKVKKRKRQTKSDSPSTILLKGLEKGAKAIKQLSDLTKNDLSNKEPEKDPRHNKTSNPNNNLQSLKNKGSKKKKKLNRSQINSSYAESSSVSPTSADKSSKRTRDNLEKCLNDIKTKTNTKNTKKLFNIHKMEDTNRIIERRQLNNTLLTPKNYKSGVVTNEDTKIHIKKGAQYFKPNTSLVLPRKEKTLNSSSAEASVSLTSANNSRKRSLDNLEFILGHMKKLKPNTKDTKKQFNIHELKNTQKNIGRRQSDNSLVIPKKEQLPEAVKDTEIRIKKKFKKTHGNKSNTTKQLRKESAEKSDEGRENTGASRKSISNINKSKNAGEIKNVKLKMLQKIKTKQGNKKSSLELHDSLYKQEVANRDTGQIKNKRKRKKNNIHY